MEPNSAQQTPARQKSTARARLRRAAERAAEKAVQKLDKKPAATDDDDEDDDDDNINMAPQAFPGEIYIRAPSAAIGDAHELAGHGG
ncbi:hypothetical protein SLS58_005100 [Diplodia intermedia]|uniref:Uncharacterized protein n=1 Tax=Diplodia intermedia TaxID=856260 RepID=A0ABR3TRQ1_9PEZI